ncbi:MAG: hypothetical protein ABI488_24535 [Polyangiaceae bacterium]
MTTTSKSVDGVQELTLIAKLKTGIVPCTGMPPSYASRLRLLLEALFTQRKHETECDQQSAGLLETLSVLRFVRWALLENDTKLMLAVEFDGPWEPYIRRIVTEAGPFLDVIFCHCEGYAGNSCQDGYEKFSSWVRERQVDIPFIYASDPELSVDDMRYLKSYERAQAAGNALLSQGAVLYPESNAPLARLYALFTLRQFFSNDGAVAGAPRPLTDQAYFDRVSGVVMSSDFGNLKAFATRVAQIGVAPNLSAAAMGAWAASLPAQFAAFQAQRTPSVPVRSLVNPHTVQGNILTSYSAEKLTHGCFALVRFKSAKSGAAFLRRVATQLTLETSPKGEGEVKLNLALTFQGLRSLGLNADELARFPKEFQEGLESRAGMLGDVGLNHPERWALPKYNWGSATDGDPVALVLVDAVLMLQTRDDSDSPDLLPALRARLNTLLSDAPHGQAEVEILHVQPTHKPDTDDKGHLGAVDGVSQPVYTEAAKVPAPFAERDRVPLGELLLGYENQTNELGALPAALRDNSTFVAIRKMTQDVEMYQVLRDQQQLALALGRAENGDNLINGTPSNDFTYGANSDQKCPLFSHIRRANPRTNAPRRMLRRGMSFGPKYTPQTASVERGVMFLAVAASLADQYEVVQRWVNGGNSTGGYSGNPDLIAGTYKPGTARKLQYRTESGVESIALPPRPAAVLRWGLYAFIPSISALNSLAEYAPGSYLPPAIKLVEPPANLADQFGAPPLSVKGEETKALLEDILKRDRIADHIADVLKNGGISSEPEYAVMVASQPLVQAMLTDPDGYSVRSYWGRMKACSATMYLGMDPRPAALGGNDPCPAFTQDVKADSYKNEATRPNEFIKEIGFDEAYDAAHAAAFKWFYEQETTFLGARELFAKQPAAIQPVAVLDLQALAARVIRDVAVALYGIPATLLSDDPDLELPGAAQGAAAQASTPLRCPVDLTSVFAHVFPPRPSRTVSEAAVKRGESIRAKVKTWYEAHPDQVKASRLIQKIRKPPSPQSEEFEQRTVVGLLSGFAVPTNGSLLSVLMQLVKSDELWRLQRTLREIDLDKPDERRKNLAPISETIYALMMTGPVPAMVHRTAMKQASFPTTDGEVKIEPGDLIALNLGGAAAQAAASKVANPWKFLFGDVPMKAAQPVHACPGQEMALGVIHGTLVALLLQRSLKKTPSPLVLGRYDLTPPAQPA